MDRLSPITQLEKEKDKVFINYKCINGESVCSLRWCTGY